MRESGQFVSVRSTSRTNSQRSRHRSEPKPPIEIPRRYITSRSNLFTFCKQNIQAGIQCGNIKPRQKLKFSSVSIERDEPQNTNAPPIENEETIESAIPKKATEGSNSKYLYTMDFDFGRLDDSKLLNRLNQTLLMSGSEPAELPPTESKTQRSTNHKSNHKSNQSGSKAPITVKVAPTTLFSASKPSSKKSNSKDSTNRSTSRSKMHWQLRMKPNVLAISESNLKFDRSIDPFEKKKLNSRIVTVATGGKLQTKIYNYPDNSQYLKICGLLK